MAKIILVFTLFFSTSLVWATDNLAEASRFAEWMKSKKEDRVQTKSTVFERFYRAGDRWTVSVSHVSHGFVRIAATETPPPDHQLAPVSYAFEVVAVDAGDARIEVKPAIQGRVLKVEFHLDREMRMTRKKYFYRDGSAPVETKSDSEQNVPMGFDSFPLDLPDFAHADVTTKGDAVHIEATDLFSRPITIVWNKGDPWPSSVETTGGKSVLFAKELRR